MSKLFNFTIAVFLSILFLVTEVSANVISKNVAKIDVCFVLDTTGSMKGMLNSAKQKIWYIANQIVSAQNRPDVRFCIIGFRDRGDRYVTDYHPLTRDIDAIHKTLMSYKAGGGGDTPESVNQALHEAVTKPSWRHASKSLRIIYLIGDSPPHMDYQNDVPYFTTVRKALQKDIYINTIQCGTNLATRRIWNQIASTADGYFSAIAQNAATTTIKTPWDQKLQNLNRQLGKTVVPYGNKSERRKMFHKQMASEHMRPSSTADRLSYNSKTGRVVQGDLDLLEMVNKDKSKLNTISDSYLPKELRGKSKNELKRYLNTKLAKRKKLQQQIKKIIKLRDEFISKKSNSLGSEFDQEIVRSLRKQAKKQGIMY